VYRDRIFGALKAILGNQGIAAKGEIDGAGNVIFVGMGNGKEVAAVVPEVDSEDEIGPTATALADQIDSAMAGGVEITNG